MEGVQVTAAPGAVPAGAGAPVGPGQPPLYGAQPAATAATAATAPAVDPAADPANPPPLVGAAVPVNVNVGDVGVGVPGSLQVGAAAAYGQQSQAQAQASAPYGSPAAAPGTAAVGGGAATQPQQQSQPDKANHPVLDEPYIIDHAYVDYAAIPPSIVLKDYSEPTNTGGISQPFPQRLHALLSTPALYEERVIGWQEHGRCFVIRQPKEFARTTMVTHFKHRQFTSFQRQLNLYGFKRLTRGPDKGAYYHELFLRGRPYLCLKMKRMKNKGVGKKPLPDPDNEPDFYSMPFVGVPGEATDDPHGVLPPGFDEVDALLEKIRGRDSGAVPVPPHVSAAAHGIPSVNPSAATVHALMTGAAAGAGTATGGQQQQQQPPNPEALKAGMAKYQAAAASLAAANAGVRQLPAQLQQQPTPMELQLQQQMRLQQMQMQQMQAQLNQYQQMHQLQMHQLQMASAANAAAANSVATGGAASVMGGYPATLGGVGGAGAAAAAGFPAAAAANPAASVAGYGGLPGAAAAAGMAAGAPGSLLPPDLARMGSGSASLLSPTGMARMASGSAQFFSPTGLQTAAAAGVPPTALARMNSGAAAASGASLLSPDLVRMSSGMGAAAAAGTPAAAASVGAAPAPSLANATLQVQAQQSQLQQLQAERARLEQQMIVTTAAADRARAEADAAVLAAQQHQPPPQSKGQSADLLWNRLASEQIATVQASAAQPTATAVAVNTTAAAAAPIGAAQMAVPSPAKLKAGVSDSTEASPLDDGPPADGDIVNTPVMHDLLAKQQALLLRELEQEKKNLEEEKRAKAASAVNKAKAAAAALGISFGKADDAVAAVTDTAALNNVGQMQQQQQGPPISSISIPQVPTNQQVAEASQQVTAAAAAVEAATTTVPAAITAPPTATEAFPTGRTSAAVAAPAAQPPVAAETAAKEPSPAPALPPPPTYEQAMDMKEDSMIAQQQAKEQLAVAGPEPAQEHDADMDSIHSQMESIGISKNDEEGGPTAEFENMDQVKRKRAIRFRRTSNTNSSLSGKSRDESAAEGSAVSAGPKKKKGRMVRLLNFAKGKGAPGAGTDGVVNPTDAVGAAAAADAVEEDPVELEEMQGDMMTESVDIDTIFSSEKSGESVAERAILESISSRK